MTGGDGTTGPSGGSATGGEGRLGGDNPPTKHKLRISLGSGSGARRSSLSPKGDGGAPPQQPPSSETASEDPPPKKKGLRISLSSSLSAGSRPSSLSPTSGKGGGSAREGGAKGSAVAARSPPRISLSMGGGGRKSPPPGGAGGSSGPRLSLNLGSRKNGTGDAEGAKEGDETPSAATVGSGGGAPRTSLSVGGGGGGNRRQSSSSSRASSPSADALEVSAASQHRKETPRSASALPPSAGASVKPPSSSASSSADACAAAAALSGHKRSRSQEPLPRAQVSEVPKPAEPAPPAAPSRAKQHQQQQPPIPPTAPSRPTQKQLPAERYDLRRHAGSAGVAIPEPCSASAAHARILHQRTHLSLCYRPPVRDGRTGRWEGGRWSYAGTTSLWLIDESDKAGSSGKKKSSSSDSVPAAQKGREGEKRREIALHLRGGCAVRSVRAETFSLAWFVLQTKQAARPGGGGNPAGGVTDDDQPTARRRKATGLRPVRVSHAHFDPLEKVLLRPVHLFDSDSFAVDKNGDSLRFEADFQSGRGGSGITDALRAASVASCLGELRLSVTSGGAGDGSDSNRERAEKSWRETILKAGGDDCASVDSAAGGGIGSMARRLRLRLDSQRRRQHRADRATLVAKKMAKAEGAAMRLTINFAGPDIEAGSSAHQGGIHLLAPSPGAPPGSSDVVTPHVYTTSGNHGDHQGPRSWLPTLDTAHSRHRSSHELTVSVTAPADEGLWCVGFGEDLGLNDVVLHRPPLAPTVAPGMGDSGAGPLAEALGRGHGQFVADIFGNGARAAARGTHVIPPPPDLATAVFVTSTWSPIPARSLGFAVGPFRVLYDAEYFNLTGDEDDEEEGGDGVDDDEEPPATVEETALQSGEGIRQLYFAPLDERSEIHADAPILGEDDDDGMGMLMRPRHSTATRSAVLLQTKRQIEASVTASTIGVPNRALSLMRDVLQLPAYRTSSFTQIWIPGAADGGSTSGALHVCPEATCNPYLGGSIIDASLLPPPGLRLPFHAGGRQLQFLQARSAVRGWIRSALPLGGTDEIGQGYLHCVVEAFIMSLYERGHGAFGEGGGRGGYYYSDRYATGSGLNSRNLDFLPIVNVEDEDSAGMMGMGGGMLGAVPIEERGNDHLWRNNKNGTESHTSALDESSIRQLLTKDCLEALERSDRNAPLPSMGWMGSHLSATFLTSNSTSSSAVGCGAIELMHPVGGMVYRMLKCESLRKIIEGRVGVVVFVRVVRSAFIAALLEDNGEEKLNVPEKEKKPSVGKKQIPASVSSSDPLSKDTKGLKPQQTEDDTEFVKPKPPFLMCVDELIKKGGLTHMLFTRALRILAGPIREPYLRGSLVDIDRNIRDVNTSSQMIEPEGFPNSFVRGASSLYLRVGLHVEPAGASSDSGAVAQSQSATGGVKGTHLHVFAEPIVPEGGCAFGGPVTIRLIENEGQCREFVRSLRTDGSRSDWGPIFLHAQPVATAKQQTAASGAIERGSSSGASGSGGLKGASAKSGVFNSHMLHRLGYQALELVRLTNRTPLLWVRVDPHGLYDGRISVTQPDASYAEQLFHDGDAAGQIDAIRALAERPLLIQGSIKINSVYDVPIAELPVRVLADCLRGSATLQSDLPHNPGIRAQAALAIGQWQNNKAPNSRDVVGADSWVGLDLLLQYFRERHCRRGTVLPVHFSRFALKRRKAPGGDDTDAHYIYLDAITEKDIRKAAINGAESVEVEEDEEYRVRASVVTAIACIRAKDGMTPLAVLSFLESILLANDEAAVGTTVSSEEEDLIRKKKRSKKKLQKGDNENGGGHLNNTDGRTYSTEDLSRDVDDIPFATSSLIADALLSLCHVHVCPALVDDPTTGTQVQSKAPHPISPLMAACHRWLEWDLYKEDIRCETELETATGVGGGCYANVSACAIIALSHLALLRQSTTDTTTKHPYPSENNKAYPPRKVKLEDEHSKKSDEAATAKYYIEIFDSQPIRSDVTKAAAAQAVACICCAADRIEQKSNEALGLLTALDFLMDRILENNTSPSLRSTLACLMLDACTGKVCSMQRVAVIGGRNDLCVSGARFMTGPLGASNGGDNGSAVLTSVSNYLYPAGNAVNDGARRGLRLLAKAGRDNTISNRAVVRVATFASKLWRTINGELGSSGIVKTALIMTGVCAHDGHLRCALLSVWQWIWPKECPAVQRVHSWKTYEGTQQYKELGCNQVMKTTDEERSAMAPDEAACYRMKGIVSKELDRQKWRGEMAMKAYDNGKTKDTKVSSSSQELNQPLPVVQKGAAWKAGGWISSAAHQRRGKGADGSHKKLRLSVQTA